MNVRSASALLASLALLGCDPSTPEPDAALSLDASRLETGPLLDADTTDRDAPPTEADDAFSPLTPDATSARRGAAAWIRAHFEGDAHLTGTFDARTRVETPALVHDATACCAKYAFDVREEAAPDRREVGFVEVEITNLESTDAFGGGVQVSGAEGATLFLANVTVDPGWPTWVSYAETNYDGLVLDGAAAIYAEDLTIRDWNADGGIDDKAPLSQFVRLVVEGAGNRALRLWGPGPHYLVESRLENEGTLGEGSLLWFSDCDTVEVRIYRSTFNGSETVPAAAISCDAGSDPNLVYLEVDPRTTGEMHEMFSY
ncbi:MAG: hypothetical protein J0L92_00925 [Deltaproteobacteria bacterium]|nr:hypothetical protein [Deltaproteobacteria bacterium]